MADNTNGITDAANSETEASTETDDKPLTKTELESMLKSVLPNLVNSAVTSHLKRAKNAPAPKAEETEPTDASESKDKVTLASMKRELDAIKAERDQAKKEARASKVVSKVSTSLDGKINSQPRFKELAVEQVLKNVSFEGDEAVITLDGVVYDLDSGIEAWTKHPSNKIFVPMPEVRKQTSVSSNFSSQDLKETDMMGEDGVHLLASLLSPKLQKN
jgi:hypothetical protein